MSADEIESLLHLWQDANKVIGELLNVEQQQWLTDPKYTKVRIAWIENLTGPWTSRTSKHYYRMLAEQMAEIMERYHET